MVFSALLLAVRTGMHSPLYLITFLQFGSLYSCGCHAGVFRI